MNAFVDFINQVFGFVYLLLTKNLSDFSPNAFSNAQLIITALKGTAVSLAVICFFMGFIKETASYAPAKNPLMIFKSFFRIIVTNGLILRSYDLVFRPLFTFAQGVIKTMFTTVGINEADASSIFSVVEIADTGNPGIFDGIFAGMAAPVIAIYNVIFTLIMLIGGVTILLVVFGRFFKIYMFMAVAPIPLSFFAGESTSHFGKSYIRNLASVLLEGAVMALGLIVFSAIIQTNIASGISMLFGFLGDFCNQAIAIFYLLALIGIIKGADTLANKLFGLS